MFEVASQKIPEPFPEEFLKLFQAVIVVDLAGEAPLAVLLPMCKELLHSVPLPAKGFTLLFRFQRWRRLRTVAVNAQNRKTAAFACPVQCPGNFVFGSRVRRAAIW